MELTSKNPRKKNIDRTEGYWIYDETGNRQLDLNCGAFAYTLGYGNQEIIDSMSQSLSTVTRAHLPLGQTTPDIENMKDLLLSTGDMGGLIWALSGSGAVEAAIHIGQIYMKMIGTPRNRVMVFGNGWHGTTSVTKKYSGLWPLDPSDHTVSIPTPVWTTLEERDEQETEVINLIREKLDHATDIGMILINPNPWFNGLNIWSKNFWSELDTIRNDYGILIITDDVASGWGKAKDYHSFKQLMPEGMSPDITCVGKAITAGYAPLSAAVASKKISDTVQGKVTYSHTFQPYIGGIAAMKATNDIIQRDNLFSKTDWIEERLLDIGKILHEGGQATAYKVFGTCATYHLSDSTIGKNLKGLYYGLSSDMSKIPNFRVCVPLIADEEYFHHLQQILLKGLV